MTGDAQVRRESVIELKELTSARGLAALAVVVYHVDAYSGGPIDALLPITPLGRLAVDFFFVLSGFVLAHVYGSAWKAGAYRHRDFLVRRFARVWPMHMASLLAVAAIVGAGSVVGLRPPWPPTWESFLAHATLLHATGISPDKAWNQPSWSVSAEWTAYLVFPLYLMLCGAIRSPAGKIAASLLLFAALWWSYRAWTGGDLMIVTNEAGALRIVPSFFAGVALRQAVGQGFGRSLAPASLDRALAGVIVVTALALLAGASNAMVWPALPAVVLLLALRSYVERPSVMRARPLIWLGDVSYALYLVHAPILMVVYGVFGKVVGVSGAPALLAVGAVAAAISIAVAGLAHYLLERPAQRLIVGFAHASRARPTPRSA
jgi:peptidoglycan/LPS O-acetylase OafA/YrhL